jgi:hypothetical protein
MKMKKIDPQVLSFLLQGQAIQYKLHAPFCGETKPQGLHLQEDQTNKE